MALYAIGDVQGCCRCLDALLTRLDFNPADDRLWFVGDLVNRGPESLRTLRRVRSLDAEVVLGNHDLHLLAVAAGARPVKQSDSFNDVLEAPDRGELLEWLAHRPLLCRDDASGWLMVHAGLPPAWDADTAERLAREVEEQLRSRYNERGFMESMYGDEPSRWEEELEGMDRFRFVTNAFTRLRFCDQDGALALGYSGPPGSQPAPWQPWYKLWPHATHRVVFGHWSALGAADHGNAVSTDSGCVWGGRLTAAQLEPGPVTFVSVGCGG
ncbi:MAG: symmetrical bis(5'-nucleosyl)-tetraphosphatase [Gammaproteobacteria bacterium]|nr:symmetrical bis(5'-nucleosyl)-tetraphosphatase [Gammaproteobacteria bacterium]